MHIMSFLELKYCQTQLLMLSENTIANSKHISLNNAYKMYCDVKKSPASC